MREVIRSVRDADLAASAGLPPDTAPEVRAAVTAVVLREFLDNEYTNDTQEDGPR
jgi:hypothetical protein